MASSNKAQDPAAAALLAIEEALNLPAAGPSAGPAGAKPLGEASADKMTEPVLGEREAATPRPGPSRPPRDAARPPEPRPAAIGGERLFGPAGANSSAPGAEMQALEPSGGAAPPMQPAND
ncbi:MAG: hypothetical protein ACREDJ_10670, partial [Methylocella sp.]